MIKSLVIFVLAITSTLSNGAYAHVAFVHPSFRQIKEMQAPAAAPIAALPEPAMDVSYVHNGQDWTAGVCKSRDLQSPLNFDDHILDPPMANFFYDYKELNNVTLKLTAADKTIHVWFPPDNEYARVGGIVLRGKYYALTRIDFKVQGEHLFRGERLPMEIQLVHRHVKNPSQFVILAVRVWCETVPPPPEEPKPEKYYPPDPAEMDFNKQLEHFLMKEPPDAPDKKIEIELTEDKPLNMSVFVEHPLISDTNTYIEYAGSLTSPPCLETVTWLVRRSKMLASNGQVKAFSDAIMRMTANKGNFRSVMPFADRKLTVLRALPGPGATGDPQLMPLGPNPRDDKEFQVAGYVDSAVKQTSQAKRYFDDFAKRAAAAAKAHADQYTKPLKAKLDVGKTKKDDWTIATEMTRDAIYGTADHIQRTMTDAIEHQARQLQHMADEASQVASAMAKLPEPPGAAPGPAPGAAPGAPGPALAPGALAAAISPSPSPAAAPGGPTASGPGPSPAPGGPAPAPGR